MVTSLLFGLVAYVLAYLFWKKVEKKYPRLVEDLQEWALPTVTVCLFIGLWVLL